MAYKFLYIDDTHEKLEKGTINGLKSTGEISIDFMYPSEWENIVNKLSMILSNYNGLILDLRLNDKPFKDNIVAQYRGSTLAQELRTLAKENPEKHDYPIILLSANDNLEKSLDATSVNLFENVINKNFLGQSNGLSYSSFRRLLVSLSQGYKLLNEGSKSISSFLSLAEEEIASLDIRFINELHEKLKKPIHIIARFLLRQVIDKPGLLIDVYYLAARIGVKMNSPDFDLLIDTYFKDAKYQGAFSTYSGRWWMSKVYKIWQHLFDNSLDIRSTPAHIKVSNLKAKTGLNDLNFIDRDKKSRSDTFWTVCKVRKVPIDTVDGFLIAGQEHKFPWQEPEYLCVDEALRPEGDFVVSPIEQKRLITLKDMYSKRYEKRSQNR